MRKSARFVAYLFGVFVFSAVIVLLGASCTDSWVSSVGALGSEMRITLYSGGVPVGEWISTGKVTSGEHGTRWAFREKGTGLYIRVTGDVVVAECVDGLCK